MFYPGPVAEFDRMSSEQGWVAAGGTRVPRVMIGSSPFLGAGQFGRKAHDYYQRFFLQPDNIAQMVALAMQQGIAGVQAVAYPPVILGVQGAAARVGAAPWCCVTVGLGDMWSELGACEVLAPAAVAMHGSYTDRNLEGALAALDRISRTSPDTLTGLATHRPGLLLPQLRPVPKQLQLLLCPFNPSGYMMEPESQRVIDEVARLRAAGVCVVAMKPLAAGAVPPSRALPYVARHCDAVAVGITDEVELTEVCRVAGEIGWLAPGP
jgi:hypothetical protein